MSDWIEWNGGMCPVPIGTLVDVKYKDGKIGKSMHAGTATGGFGIERTALNWEKFNADGCIIAYRLAEPISKIMFPDAAADSEQPDLVNAPPHYKQGAIECIDAIRSALTADEFRGHCKANAIKYIWRESHKGGDESIRKAIWYLTEMLK